MAFAIPLAFAQARSQTPQFRVTDLKNLGSASDTSLKADAFGTMGINDKGQVVYAYHDSGGLYHAWFWLPAADYGFAADTVYALDTSENTSVARDINENGVIVGDSGGGPPDTRATLWTLASSTITPSALDTVFSHGYAISNDSTPHVTGQRQLSELCSERPETATCSAVLWVPGDSPVDLGSIVNGLPSSIGYDILRDGNDVIVGLALPCEDQAECNFDHRGQAWDLDATVLEIGSIRSSAHAWAATAYGVNDDANIVGWVSFQPYQQITCPPTAAFWASPSVTDPIDLAAYLPNAFDASRAFAINNVHEVVGKNENTLHAVLWVDDAGWSGIDLNDSASGVIAECSDALWTITEGHDINSNGWIVALGMNGSNELHALLLTPFPACPVDIVPNGCADVNDLLAVINHWGACQAASICSADVNADCTVDVNDLLAVNNAWGCNACESGFSASSGTPPTLAEMIALVLSAPIASSTQTQIIGDLIANWP